MATVGTIMDIAERRYGFKITDRARQLYNLGFIHSHVVAAFLAQRAADLLERGDTEGREAQIALCRAVRRAGRRYGGILPLTTEIRVDPKD
ncbi:hypothetical protein ACFV4N_23870 [Actinosynnema sp. NPDC059797]